MFSLSLLKNINIFFYIATLVPTSEKPKIDQQLYQKLNQYIINPASEQDRFYNSVLKELYEIHYGHITENHFRELYYRERRKRWRIKSIINDTNQYLVFEKSGNPASSKKYITCLKLTSLDQSTIKLKIQRVNEKLEYLEHKIKKEEKKYEVFS